MSKVEKPCLFDNTKECPVQKAGEIEIKERIPRSKLLNEACPICPKRLSMIPSRKIK